MKPLRVSKEVKHYGRLASEMMLTEMGEEYEFNPRWIRSQGWKVVPAECMTRIPTPDIPRIVSVLRGSGYRECVAIFNEAGYIQSLPVIVASNPPGHMATTYVVAVDEADFEELNHELGIFRFLLMDENRSWAISCTEWYNLFAGEAEFVESLLGKPIDLARREFSEFASLMAQGNAAEPLMRVAKHYAAF